MAGDKKGKGKSVVEAKKKRSRDEREWARALVAADAADQSQRFVRIRGSEAEAKRQGEPRGHTTATPLSAYTHLRDSSALTASSQWSTNPRRCSSEARDSHAATVAGRAADRG